MVAGQEIKKSTRLRELDFLRGIAILLILMRHRHIFPVTTKTGWIGVDLFFVLSGFLVSGLLFQEYIRFGNIRPGLFLIRRGFKIYPVYYIFFIPYLIQILIQNDLKIIPLASDLLFIQNYVSGWGYAYGASWSLAVEEHYYFSLSLLLSAGLSFGWISSSSREDLTVRKISISYFIISIMVACFLLRVGSNYFFPYEYARNFTMTHLRIDSLLAGVLISYYYNFKKDFLLTFYKKYKYLLLIISIAGLSWTPFFDAITSIFVKTIGFSLLYISFGIILIYFLVSPTINLRLNKIFTKTVTDVISRIGFCSYSIYIIHQFINWSIDAMLKSLQLNLSIIPLFILSFLLSIFAGIFMTYKVEHYFLSMRNRYFPGRV